jgi:putative transposase
MELKPRLWEVPDHLWEKIRPILDSKDPRKRTGRPRADQRRIIDGIIFKIRTGCQWNLIPRVYGSDTTIHRWLKRWTNLGIWQELWKVLAQESPELAQADWESEIREDSEARKPRRASP